MVLSTDQSAENEESKEGLKLSVKVGFVHSKQKGARRTVEMEHRYTRHGTGSLATRETQETGQQDNREVGKRKAPGTLLLRQDATANFRETT